MDLFKNEISPNAPLAAKMRPQNLYEYVGQQKILGPGTLLRKAIEHDKIGSLIFLRTAGSRQNNLSRDYCKNYGSPFCPHERHHCRKIRYYESCR